MLKDFYEKHRNFSCRTATEYYISPGIKCKFDLIRDNLDHKRKFVNGIDLGSSGNSILTFLENIENKSFYDIANLPLYQYSNGGRWHPLCGDLTSLPYRDESFDLVCALDVLEHIKNDKLAITEISRIIKKNGMLVITVPHRMKYYSMQDRIIGHYRRYEKKKIISLFSKFNLLNIQSFGIYGVLMKIADIQSTNPDKVEYDLIKLRNRYESDIAFQKFWNCVQRILSLLMKIDAKYHSHQRIRNIGFIFIKK